MTPIQQFKRYMWLVDLLYSRGAMTRKQINDAWAHSSLNDEDKECIAKRTFFRMKEDIWRLFRIDIECVSGNKYTITNRNDLKGNDVQRWLLDSFAVSNLLIESQQLKERVLLEDIPSGNKYLTLVLAAMESNKTLNIEYQSFQMSEPRAFELEPYCLKVFKQRWYILAPRVGEKETHFYSLDRVLSMEITENSFKLPKNFNADAYFNNYYGIMQGDTKPEFVRIRANVFRSNYLRSLPLHHSQKEIETSPEYSVFEYYIAPTADFIQELRSISPDITILQPEWLRAKLCADAKTILTNHKN